MQLFACGHWQSQVHAAKWGHMCKDRRHDFDNVMKEDGGSQCRVSSSRASLRSVCSSCSIHDIFWASCERFAHQLGAFESNPASSEQYARSWKHVLRSKVFFEQGWPLVPHFSSSYFQFQCFLELSSAWFKEMVKKGDEKLRQMVWLF